MFLGEGAVAQRGDDAGDDHTTTVPKQAGPGAGLVSEPIQTGDLEIQLQVTRWVTVTGR